MINEEKPKKVVLTETHSSTIQGEGRASHEDKGPFTRVIELKRAL